MINGENIFLGVKVIKDKKRSKKRDFSIMNLMISLLLEKLKP